MLIEMVTAMEIEMVMVVVAEMVMVMVMAMVMEMVMEMLTIDCCVEHLSWRVPLPSPSRRPEVFSNTRLMGSHFQATWMMT